MRSAFASARHLNKVHDPILSAGTSRQTVAHIVPCTINMFWRGGDIDLVSFSFVCGHHVNILWAVQALATNFNFKTTASWDLWTSQSQPHPRKRRKWWRRKRRYWAFHNLIGLWNLPAWSLIGVFKEYEAKLEERQKAEKLKFRCKIEEKINAFLKDDKSKTLKFPAMDKFQRLVTFCLSNVRYQEVRTLLQVCYTWCLWNCWSSNPQFWGGGCRQTYPGIDINSANTNDQKLK